MIGAWLPREFLKGLDHLRGDRVGLGEVAPGQELPEVESLGHLLQDSECAQ